MVKRFWAIVKYILKRPFVKNIKIKTSVPKLLTREEIENELDKKLKIKTSIPKLLTKEEIENELDKII